MNQAKAQQIVESNDFSLKNTMNIILTCRENHLITRLLHECIIDTQLMDKVSEHLKECKDDEQTPVNFSTKDELNRLYSKLIISLFTRDPEKSKVMAIADGNSPDERIFSPDEFGNYVQS